MHKIYLVKVWKANKLLFFAILFFIAGQAFFSVKRIQNFPFFIFDMYSRPFNAPSEFTIYEIRKNGRSLDYTQFSNVHENAILNSIKSYEQNSLLFPLNPYESVIQKRFSKNLSSKNYTAVLESLSNDSASMEKFPEWFKSYICSPRDEIILEKNTYRYPDNVLLKASRILKSDAK